MSRFTTLFAALSALAISLAFTAPAHAGPCGNDQLNAGEVCDTTKFTSTPVTCANLCPGKPVGSVSCYGPSATAPAIPCTVNCSGCSAAPDLGTPDSTVDAGPPTDAGASPDAGPPPTPGTCRTYNSTDTYFEAGSLIIPMDTDCQNAGAEIRAFGIVWQLLRNGIRVSWILNRTKATIDQDDFTVTGPVSPVVHRLARSGAYDDFVAISDPKCSPTTTHGYPGAPMVIAASDADAALRLIYQGVLTDNPTVKYGWAYGKHDVFTDFSDVEIHRATVGFTAPVQRTSSNVPRPVALLQTTSWLDSEVLQTAGLAFPGAGGTPSSPGLIFDQLTPAEAAGGTLDVANYQMAWINGEGAGAITSSSAYTEIADFVNAGSALVASGSAILAMECNSCASWDCSLGCTPPTQFQGTTGVIDGPSGHGSGHPPQLPNHPMTQVDDLDYHGLAEEVQTYFPVTTWKPCTNVLLVNGFGRPLASLRDDMSMGQVFYISGRNYDSGKSPQMRAMQRTVINLLFFSSEQTQEEHPTKYELTRSTPLVIDAEDDTEHVVFQGTYDWPDPSKGRYFTPNNVEAWTFPITTGHLRAYDLGSLSTTISSFDGTSSIWAIDAIWAGTGGIPGAGCSKLGNTTGCTGNCTFNTSLNMCTNATTRNLYTATGSSSLSLLPFTSASGTVATLEPLVGVTGATETARLIEAVRSAPLGGIDQSSAALAVHSPDIPFPDVSGAPYERPAVLYIGSLDGMLHAFKVRDVEKKTGSYGTTELWSFLLPDQLGNLRNNTAAVQGSPSVVDVYGDFVQADGTAGQDNQSEWISLLTITAGATGKAVYALDISQPDPNPSSSVPCPTRSGATACVKGPNPLWVADATSSTDTADMGGTRKAALGVINRNGDLVPAVVIVTNIGNATGGAGGWRLYVLNATDGSLLLKRSRDYTYTEPNGLLTPNDVPPRVMLVDKGGDAGYQTHAYIGDLEGKLWEVDLENPTVNRAMYTSEVRWDAHTRLGGAASKCTYPIASPMSMYRDTGGRLHAVVVTGGIWWASSDGSSGTQQKVVDIAGLDSYYVTDSTVYAMAAGERVYTAPAVVDGDVYFQTSEALVDQLSGWTSAGAAGTLYTASVASGTATTATSLASVGMTGASLAVSSGGRVVSASARGISVQDNPTPTAESTAPQREFSGKTVGLLRLWLPNLRN